MFKKIGVGITTAVLIFLYQSKVYSTTYSLIPGQSMVVSNTLTHSISGYCLISAYPDAVNSILITMQNGTGLFNGTSLSPGQTLNQNVYNTQYIPFTASARASALIKNTNGKNSYAIQAECYS